MAGILLQTRAHPRTSSFFLPKEQNPPGLCTRIHTRILCAEIVCTRILCLYRKLPPKNPMPLYKSCTQDSHVHKSWRTRFLYTYIYIYEPKESYMAKKSRAQDFLVQENLAREIFWARNLAQESYAKKSYAQEFLAQKILRARFSCTRKSCAQDFLGKKSRARILCPKNLARKIFLPKQSYAQDFLVQENLARKIFWARNLAQKSYAQKSYAQDFLAKKNLARKIFLGRKSRAQESYAQKILRARFSCPKILRARFFCQKSYANGPDIGCGGCHNSYAILRVLALFSGFPSLFSGFPSRSCAGHFWPSKLISGTAAGPCPFSMK